MCIRDRSNVTWLSSGMTATFRAGEGPRRRQWASSSASEPRSPPLESSSCSFGEAERDRSRARAS
eukprot:10775028-Lingulodinium_polyedra.AAC.1